jgi:3-oxoacyl-[acyl-carrier protein] reductase
MSVQGQVVIVTGGAKGIGRYIAHSFAKEGATTVIADVDRPRLEQTAEELQEMAPESLAVPTDVRDEAEVRRLIDQVARRFGRIDVLVNNAAMVPHFEWGVPTWPRVRDMDLAFWEKVMDTAINGTFLCTKHVVPHMEARRAGHIINLYGGGNRIGACAYVVTKDAIRTMTRFVAQEEREFDVCVVCMRPGATIAHEDAPEDVRQRMPGTDVIGNRFVLAAQVGMELSGQLLILEDGRLVAQQ